MILLIDDERDLPADIVARNYEIGLATLVAFIGKLDVLKIDHDLASFDENGNELTGYDLVKNTPYLPRVVEIVSANPVGVENIGAYLRSLGYISDFTRRTWRKH